MGYCFLCIYICIGDDGSIGFGDGQCVVKDDVWVVFYGIVDEVNVVFGLLFVIVLFEDVCVLVVYLQYQLFDLGVEFCILGYVVIYVVDVLVLEQQLDYYNVYLLMLKEFILLVGGEVVVCCYLVCIIVCCVECEMVILVCYEVVCSEVLQYFNWLLDLLFVLVCVLVCVDGYGEVLWQLQQCQC